jgi:hypothetical protein
MTASTRLGGSQTAPTPFGRSTLRTDDVDWEDALAVTYRRKSP